MGHGLCLSNSTCKCDLEYAGENCALKRCPNNCSGRSHGICYANKCVCNDKYYGHDCSQRRCVHDCGGHGKCLKGKCTCRTGYSGATCQTRVCPGRIEPCNGNGRCDEANGICRCRRSWTGIACNVSTCFDRGVWNSSKKKCICNPGFYDTFCHKVRCPGNREKHIECSGHGLCNSRTGQCVCNVGFTGVNCAAPFALLSGINKTLRGGGSFRGETIDSYASRLDAMESAQLLNETMMVRSGAHIATSLPLNFSAKSAFHREEGNAMLDPVT